MANKIIFLAIPAETDMEDVQILSGQPLLDVLRAQDWATLLPQLQAYAIISFKKYRIKSERGMLGKQSKDFMQEAIKMVYQEERKWNTTAYPDLFTFIAGIIDSLISNYLSKKKSELTTSEFDSLVETDQRISHGIDGMLVARGLFQLLQKELDGDNDALIVLDCMADGMMKPKDIREDLGLSEDGLNNILKRIRRARDRAIPKMK